MRSIKVSSASSAPPFHPPILQTARVRRRISASDSVAALVASLAFPEPVDRPWSFMADVMVGGVVHGR